MKHTVDKNYFPGWVRKSMTFTIDDGNVYLDKKFLAIAKPAGLRGTFNLCSHDLGQTTHDDYLSTYDGFEIADHCKYHPLPFTPERVRPIADSAFDFETADRTKNYRSDVKGLYYYYDDCGRWWNIADDDDYIEFARLGKEELEVLFGKGNVVGFVWPFGEQKNSNVSSRLKQMGFAYIRITGCVKGTTGFALPSDRMAWSYNANYICMMETAAEYEAYPDDGELKFYCFGVHSHDFENAGRWDVLEQFCEKYGNRPEDFWYASVIDIFRYENAVAAIEITDTEVKNPSDIDLYIKIDGKRVTLRRHSSVPLA